MGYPRLVTLTATLVLAGGLGRSASAGKPKAAPTPRPLTTVEALRVPLKPAERPMADLEAALTSAEATTRAAAAWELAGAGTVPESVGNRLKEALTGDPDPRVRTAAVWALAHVRQGIAEPDGKLQPTPFDEQPRLVQQARLAYPQEAFDAGIQGTVVVEMVVDEEGRVPHAEARASVPPLDAAALAAVREWRFTPAKLAGKPVGTVVSVPVEFTIRREE